MHQEEKMRMKKKEKRKWYYGKKESISHSMKRK